MISSERIFWESLYVLFLISSAAISVFMNTVSASIVLPFGQDVFRSYAAGECFCQAKFYHGKGVK
jgi:hypothetical protein